MIKFFSRASLSWAGLAAMALGTPGRAAAPAPGAAILQDLKSFNTVATVLHIAAHPDDENTQLITYFARGRGYRMGYLSLTRGDGGQNEIGPEFDEKLGVARTQELLAARRLDGGRQFFTRAIDFGFSKTAEETLSFWDRAQVLGDVVRVIRRFRPDVLVTRFSPGSSGLTHGHHTSSGILGVEAFKLAGDPKAYPEQLAQGLTVWQPKRVVLNAGGPGGAGRGGGGGAPLPSGTIRVDIGGNDPVTGESLSAIAGRSRGQHTTQGFGEFGGGGRGGGRGGAAAGGANVQSFVPMDGEPATNDLMDGIDTTWARVPGGAEVGRLAAAAIAQFKGEDPSASVAALLVVRSKLAALASDPVVDDKRRQLDSIIQRCLGLEVETEAPTAEAIPGESVKLKLSVTTKAGVPVKWQRVKSASGGAVMNATLEAGKTLTREYAFKVPANTLLTQPYWLREEGSFGMAKVSDPTLIGTAENPPALPIYFTFEIGGQTLVVTDEPVNIGPPVGRGPSRRKLDVIPPVSLAFGSNVAIFAPGGSRALEVEVTAARPNASGTLQLEAPVGWTVKPASQSFGLTGVGQKTRLTFSVTAPAQPASGVFGARATVNGTSYFTQRAEIRYNHIPVQLLQPPARVRAVAFDITTRGQSVGYLPGAGDGTAEALEQLGCKVTTLSGADLTAEKLRGLDAVVIGVRAFNERKDLETNLPGLFAYVENGGTVIVQYNRPNGLQAPMLGPYPLSIQGSVPNLRVTDEKATVTFLAPEEKVLVAPNRLSASDFEGWVQERGAYFPSTWDAAHYVPIFAMSDSGEAPLTGGLLVARHGKGYYVYTGLAFFRQLPAGVPGAYRLFANLISLGK